MEFKIVCNRSKKGNLYYALSVNGVLVTFDVRTIMRVSKLDYRDIYLMNEGDEIELP